MIDFNFVSPTKVFFGKNKEDELGNILNSYNFKRVLLVYGKSSIKKNGLYEKVINQLKSAGVFYKEVSEIRANPEVNKVIEGIAECRKNNLECVIAIGGGSVIDTAKLICVGYYYNGNPFDFNLHKVEPTKSLPLGVILTISASGSELSDSCVVMDDKTKIKQGFNSDVVRPMFAIMNPEITYSVNKYQTGCGIVDIISHSLERYFSKSGELEISDSLALSVIKETIKSGLVAINKPCDYNARASLMLLGSISHNGLTNLGKAKVMPIHKMEHALSSYDINIAHGAGLAVLIPGWMEYCYKYDLDKFVRFSNEIFNIQCEDKEQSAKIGIQSLKEYFKKIGMPTSLGELNLRQKDIPYLVDMITENGTRVIGLSSIKPFTKEDLINMFNAIL